TMAQCRLDARCLTRALGLAAALAIPLRARAATQDPIPDDAAIRAGADLWFDEHIAPSLHAPTLEIPGSLLGTASPAPETPLPARAIGRRLPADSYVADPLQPDPFRPVWFTIPFPLPHA